MAMTLVTGPPGTGKTWYAIRKIASALLAGKFVATNIQLHDGWAYAIASTNIWLWIRRGRKGVLAKAREYERKVFVSGDLTELFAVRLPDCGRCKACKAGRGCQTEGRGEILLDEAHEWLNARLWDVDHTGAKRTREEAVEARLAVVKFFALHRKLGWNVKLITQSEKRLDNQVRDNFEYHTRLKNMRKFRLLGLVPVVPFNWFVAITFWHASGGERVSIESYFLTKLADIYDTMARPEVTFGGGDERVIRLPLSGAEVQARRDGSWRAPWQAGADGGPDGRTEGAIASPGRSARPSDAAASLAPCR